MPKSVTTTSVRVFVSRKDIRMVDTPLGMRITCRDSLYDASPGEPALPRRYIRVALPDGHTAKGVSVKVLRTVELTDRFTLVRPMPVSTITTTPDGRSITQERTPAPNQASYRAVYGASHETVARLVATEGSGVAPAAVVAVSVVGVSKEGFLELFSDIEITVSYTAIDGFRAAEGGMRNYRIKKAIADAVNPEDVDCTSFGYKKSAPALSGSPAAETPSAKRSAAALVPTDVDYLIITDDCAWDAYTITPGASVDTAGAKMLDAFSMLAVHKKQRGYRVHVARVSNIVAGQYGNFKAGARDLQEVLRNFLKDFCPRHGVEWVLLGGDINIIPARYAVATGGAYQLPLGTVTNPIPEGVFGHVEFKGNCLVMRVNPGKIGTIPPLFLPPEGPPVDRHELTMLRSGKLVDYDDSYPVGGAKLRWFHTPDSTFAGISPVATEWIRVEGPAEVINSEAMWYTYSNRIPTDLYYSSLHAPTYNVPGRHDWDLQNNGIYGQWSAADNLDGVDYEASVGLGRAPIRNADQAMIFCRKVIDYELSPQRPAEQQRYRSVVYVAEHVDRSFRRITALTLGMASDADYYLNLFGRTMLHAKVLATGAIDEIISHIDADQFRRIPFDTSAGPTRRGWYYAKGLYDPEPSILTNAFLEMMGIIIPVPTEFVAVFSQDAAELTPMHFVLDGNDLDPAIADTHELAVQVYEDFPLIDQRLCLYTDEPDLGWTAGTGVPATVRHLTSATLTPALQQGPHFVSLNGHGGPGGCCLMNNAFINGLNNGTRLFVAWAVSCSTSDMDNPDSFGKRMVVHAGGGAVAYVGFTRSSIGYPGPKCRLAFFDALRKTRHLARLHDARLNMWAADWMHRFDILSCTLYGDPEMPVYRDHRDAIPLFIGNRGTKELHEDRCPWTRYITKKAYFSSVQEGLSVGYDGCGFCLREHHTR